MSRATEKAFKHQILLAPVGFSPQPRRIRRSSSIAWKTRALYAMRRRFYFQVLKSDVKLKQRWSSHYFISRIGAPDTKEFLCRETFYVAQMSKQEHAVKFRSYWYWCRLRSFQILEWLWELDVNDYCWVLHQYLKGFIVTKRPILAEVERYDERASEEIAIQIFGKWRDSIYRDSDKEQAETLQRSAFK